MERHPGGLSVENVSASAPEMSSGRSLGWDSGITPAGPGPLCSSPSAILPTLEVAVTSLKHLEAFCVFVIHIFSEMVRSWGVFFSTSADVLLPLLTGCQNLVDFRRRELRKCSGSFNIPEIWISVYFVSSWSWFCRAASRCCHSSHEHLPPDFVLWLFLEKTKIFVMCWNAAIILNHFHPDCSLFLFQFFVFASAFPHTYTSWHFSFICISSCAHPPSSSLCFTHLHLCVAAAGLSRGNQVSKASASGLMKLNLTLFEMQWTQHSVCLPHPQHTHTHTHTFLPHGWQFLLSPG